MTVDLETWIIETGDTIIRKLYDEDSASLTSFEWAVYWMWTIDYAVRNSGCLGPLEEMESTAIHDLHAFSTRFGLLKLVSWIESSADEIVFCKSYYEQFEVACGELRDAYNKLDVLPR